MHEIKEKLSVEQIQQKFIERLSPSGWSHLLRGYLFSSDFTNMLEFLINENQEGRRFTPAFKQLFRAFEECPVDKLKVIMIGQDPYPQPLVADGISFSCSNTNKAEASLRYILNAVIDTVPAADQDVIDDLTKFNLVRWSNQGVLMLNSALTTEIGKTGRHVDQWKSFINYIIDMLNFQQSGLVYCLMGKQAQSFEDIISENHAVIKSTHPAHAAYLKQHKWDCNDIFNRINLQLADYKKEKILW